MTTEPIEPAGQYRVTLLKPITVGRKRVMPAAGGVMLSGAALAVLPAEAIGAYERVE